MGVCVSQLPDIPDSESDTTHSVDSAHWSAFDAQQSQQPSLSEDVDDRRITSRALVLSPLPLPPLPAPIYNIFPALSPVAVVEMPINIMLSPFAAVISGRRQEQQQSAALRVPMSPEDDARAVCVGGSSVDQSHPTVPMFDMDDADMMLGTSKRGGGSGTSIAASMFEADQAPTSEVGVVEDPRLVESTFSSWTSVGMTAGVGMSPMVLSTLMGSSDMNVSSARIM